MSRTRIVLATSLIVGGLVLALAAIPALAQSSGGMPMHGGSPSVDAPTGPMMSGGGMMGMHGQSSSDQLAQMQQLHEQMPIELREQMQAWHEQQGITSGMPMMGGQHPSTMHAQMPQELQEQMRAWYAQAPAELKEQMPAMHGAQTPAGCPMADDTSPSDVPAEDATS